MRRPVVLLGMLAALAAPQACSHRAPDDGTAPAAARSLPPLTIKDDTPDLMLTWVDDKGDAHVSCAPPTCTRHTMVRVVLSNQTVTIVSRHNLTKGNNNTYTSPKQYTTTTQNQSKNATRHLAKSSTTPHTLHHEPLPTQHHATTIIYDTFLVRA